MPATDTANPIDIYVGSRIRLRRNSLKISQGTLADALGLTFQQVQKYERGTNRVSASKLYDTARVLEVPVGFFFEGLQVLPEGDVSEVDAMSSILKTQQGYAMAKLFLQLPQSARGGVVSMLRGLVEASTDQEPAA